MGTSSGFGDLGRCLVRRPARALPEGAGERPVSPAGGQGARPVGMQGTCPAGGQGTHPTASQGSPRSAQTPSAGSCRSRPRWPRRGAGPAVAARGMVSGRRWGVSLTLLGPNWRVGKNGFEYGNDSLGTRAGARGRNGVKIELRRGLRGRTTLSSSAEALILALL